MSGAAADARWMGAALALAERGRGRTSPNPSVGCVLVREDRVVGRGWTQPGGRPHAEAMALGGAGEAARGATAYVTLEPCAVPGRGPACAGALVAAGVGRVVVATGDPFPAVNGAGFAALAAAGIPLTVGIGATEAGRSMAGFLTRQRLGRPFVTLKLATSLDGAIALASGESRWITDPEARAHAHLERSRHEAILVGRGTWETDAPALDVRLPGLEGRSPMQVVLSRHPHSFAATPLPPASGRSGSQPDLNSAGHCSPDAPAGRGKGAAAGGGKGKGEVCWIKTPADIASLPGDHLLVEGGARTAAAFLAADLVDRLLLYRAPILIGGGKPALADIGLTSLADAHGRWRLHDARQLGTDRLEVYERA